MNLHSAALREGQDDPTEMLVGSRRGTGALDADLFAETPGVFDGGKEAGSAETIGGEDGWGEKEGEQEERKHVELSEIEKRGMCDFVWARLYKMEFVVLVAGREESMFLRSAASYQPRGGA